MRRGHPMFTRRGLLRGAAAAAAGLLAAGLRRWTGAAPRERELKEADLYGPDELAG